MSHCVQINKDTPAIFDFWATWCGPCRAISPVFEKMSESGDFAGVGFYKVDVDAVPDVSQEVGIRAVRVTIYTFTHGLTSMPGYVQMPTFAVFKDGSKIDELVGADRGALQTLVVNARK